MAPKRGFDDDSSMPKWPRGLELVFGAGCVLELTRAMCLGTYESLHTGGEVWKLSPGIVDIAYNDVECGSTDQP